MRDLAMAVVIRDGLVLIQHRWRKSGWVYEFPGGAVEHGEPGEAAARRELREETGLCGCQLTGSAQSKNEHGGLIHFIVLTLMGDQQPARVDEIRQQTFYWMRPQDIPVALMPKADGDFICNELLKIMEF